MASEKELEEEIEKLHKEAAQAVTQKQQALLELERVKKRYRRRGEQIKNLKHELKQARTTAIEEPLTLTEPSTEAVLGQTRVAQVQRQAWKRHQYLQKRFEYHVTKGVGKHTARNAANKDLVSQFGPGAGYSAQQLEAILQ